MNANIFMHEFRSRLHSALIWGMAGLAVALVYLSFFPSFAENAALLNQAMKNFPPELLAAFGMTDIDLSQLLGFFTFVYLFLQILMAIQASNYGFALVSVEERELTADFLLSKPVSRPQILTSKLLAALADLAITQTIVWASVYILVIIFKGDSSVDYGFLARMMAGLIPFQLFFLSVGLVISLLVKRVRSVTPYSMGLAFGMYVLVSVLKCVGE